MVPDMMATYLQNDLILVWIHLISSIGVQVAQYMHYMDLFIIQIMESIIAQQIASLSRVKHRLGPVCQIWIRSPGYMGEAVSAHQG